MPGEKNENHPVVRISRGRFAAEKFEGVEHLIDESATVLIPASSTTTPVWTRPQVPW
jgi:hypothetical protein